MGSGWRINALLTTTVLYLLSGQSVGVDRIDYIAKIIRYTKKAADKSGALWNTAILYLHSGPTGVAMDNTVYTANIIIELYKESGW